jgi:hypothetical protein
MKRAALLLLIVVQAAACDSEPRRTVVTSPSPIVPPGTSSVPTPTISSITPGFVIAGSSDLELKVTGTSFSRALQGSPFAIWVPNGAQQNSVVLTTTFAIETELRAVIPAALLTQPGAVDVTVMNGDIRGFTGSHLGYPRSSSVRFRVMPASYLVTLRASASCAAALPLRAQERTYSAALRPDGRLGWTGPTLASGAISGATISEDAFSFYIEGYRDPASEYFFGLWDDMGPDTFLQISGKASGTVHDEEITGTMDGPFTFYEPGRGTGWHSCEATDHPFRMVKQ